MIPLPFDFTRRIRSTVSIALAALLGGSAWAQTTERVSVATGGTQTNDGSYNAAISSDGRYVAFYSDATNLVSGDTNARRDAFVHDHYSGTTERVSVGPGGVEGNNWTSVNLGPIAISPDGRYVVFDSDASNIVAGDTNAATDIFLRDRVSGTTERVNVGTGGVQANGPGRLYFSSISSDGRYVVFSSSATNLVAGDTNGFEDVFVRDRQSGTTERVSVGAGGAQSNQVSNTGSITPDGRYVGFDSDATNLVAGDTNGFTDIFVRDRQAATTEIVSVATGGTQGDFVSTSASMSADGGFVAFYSGTGNLVPGDTNGAYDVFLRDRQSGTTERVSVATSGTQGDSASAYPSISADSRFVAFYSGATNLVAGDTNAAADIFVHDRLMGTTERADVDSSGNQANGIAGITSLSGDGRFVAFGSYATNLVPGDSNARPDIFVRDRLCVVRATEIVSVDSSETQGNGASTYPSMSGDRRYVAFNSDASNLVAGDTNGFPDVFVRDRQSGTTERVSVATGGAQANSGAGDYWPSISPDGRFVAFVSGSSNLVAGDTNVQSDIFVRDRQNGTTDRVSVATGGAQGNSYCALPSISADGRFVAFWSNATNLVASDTNGVEDVFVRDRQNGTTERVSVATGGAQANGYSVGPSISADGRFVAFPSIATNLVPGDTNGWSDVFVRDRQNGTTERVSVSNSGAQWTAVGSDGPRITPDGRFVTFVTVHPVGGGFAEIYVRDRQSATTEWLSVALGGALGNADSLGFPSISDDGRFVAFPSSASNLVAGDTNGFTDVFVRDRQKGTTERVSVDSDGAQGNSDSSLSMRTSISADGHFVAFDSGATNLVPVDANGFEDVFVHESYTPGFTSLCDPGVGGVIGCPCSNPPSGPGRGCNNSSGTGGARLTASGFPCLSMDSLVFTTSGEKPTALSIVWQGPTSPAAGLVFGQGVRCVNGNLKRLYFKTAAGGSITAPDFGSGDLTVSARSAALGSTILPGQSRYYFVSYRDPAVLGGCPASSTVNASQTGRVEWSG